MRHTVSIILTLILCLPTLQAQNLTPQKKGKLWGYVDDSGNYIVAPQFTAVGDFRSGYTWVNKGGKVLYDEYVAGGKFGVINDRGEIVCPVEYDFVDLCYDNIVAFNKGCVFNTESDALEGGKWGYYNLADMKEITPAQYTQLSAFYPDGVAWVQNGGNMVYKLRLDIEKDNKGNIKDKSYQFNVTKRYRLRSHFKKFNSSGKWALINSDGKTITGFDYTSVGDVRNSMAFVYNGGYGAIDTKGSLTVPCVYEQLSDCYEGGLFWAYQVDDGDNSKIGLIDKNNNALSEFKYQKAFPFRDSAAWVLKDGMYAIVNTKGKEVCDFKYKYHGPFSNNVAWVSDGKSFGLVKNTGEEIVPLQYVKTQLLFGEDSFIKFTSKNGDTRAVGWVIGPADGSAAIFDPAKVTEITKKLSTSAAFSGGEVDKEKLNAQIYKELGLSYIWFDDNGNRLAVSDNKSYTIEEKVPESLWDY